VDSSLWSRAIIFLKGESRSNILIVVANFCLLLVRHVSVGASLRLHGGVLVPPADVTYRAASREVIELRLGKYGGGNQQREATLKQLFTDAGCDDQHLSEQPVKGSKLPNVVCLLPGTSGRVIIVGAHFDRADEGDGTICPPCTSTITTKLIG
jgi:hypothetical protein